VKIPPQATAAPLRFKRLLSPSSPGPDPVWAVEAMGFDAMDSGFNERCRLAGVRSPPEICPGAATQKTNLSILVYLNEIQSTVRQFDA
jgi:hypothetical protein